MRESKKRVAITTYSSLLDGLKFADGTVVGQILFEQIPGMITLRQRLALSHERIAVTARREVLFLQKAKACVKGIPAPSMRLGRLVIDDDAKRIMQETAMVEDALNAG